MRYDPAQLYHEIVAAEEGWAAIQARKDNKRGLIYAESHQGDIDAGDIENAEIDDKLRQFPWKLEDVLHVPERKRMSKKDIPYVREQ